MAAFINDRFLEDEEAVLHISDLSMQRGYAIFDFFRTMDAIPLFMDDHLSRFYASAEAMRLPVQKSREEISSIVHELVKRSSLSEAGIRMMLTGGYSPDAYQSTAPNLLITCNPIKTATIAEFERGYNIMTYEHQRELPHVKSINYLVAVWLQPILKENQMDDVLYYRNNTVTEFPRSNVFVVTKDNKLVTPSRNILLGITRKKVLALAADVIAVEERDITLDELTRVSEIFLTSTTKRILPVTKLNGHFIGNGKPGPVTKTLYEKFNSLERSAAHLVSR